MVIIPENRRDQFYHTQSCLDSRLTLTTPIPDPPSQHDTAPIPALRTTTPITSTSLRHCTRLTSIQGRAKVCVWGNSHIQRVPRTRSYSNHLLVLHNTAYPSTNRSALHSATNRYHQSSYRGISNKRSSSLLCLEESAAVLWAADANWPLPLPTVSTEISVRWTFPQNVTSENSWGKVLPKDLFWKWTTSCGQAVIASPLKVRS